MDTFGSGTRPARRRRAFLSLLATASSLLALTQAAQAATRLSDDQHRAYLRYYAPLIMKRANGDGADVGKDWISNFWYDGNERFDDNGRNWRGKLPGYVRSSQLQNNDPAYAKWQIRPTLYTSLIEFQEGNSKEIVLLYHVYHGADESWSDPDNKGNGTGHDQTHDWERVEIRLSNASGTPGSSAESVKFVAVTNHGETVVRRNGSADLNYMSTTGGKHVMLWSAEWSFRTTDPHGNELRFVQDAYTSYFVPKINGTALAATEVSDESDKKVHYVFVPEDDAAAVSAWKAKPITYASAYSLGSTYDNNQGAPWTQVKRVTYELQDIADVFPTHWQNNPWERHWLPDTVRKVKFKTPMTVLQSGQNAPLMGVQSFYTDTRDIDGKDRREGYPDKGWFYGAYDMFDSACGTVSVGCGGGNFKDKAWAGSAPDSNGKVRDQANDDTGVGHGTYWYQHDFFAHTGQTNGSAYGEYGYWLQNDWYTAAKGGYDGRWQQLFPDRGVSITPALPLSLSLYVATACGAETRATATVKGARPLYTVTSTQSGGGSGAQTTQGSVNLYPLTGRLLTVTARSADGQTVTKSATPRSTCQPGEQQP